MTVFVLMKDYGYDGNELDSVHSSAERAIERATALFGEELTWHVDGKYRKGYVVKFSPQHPCDAMYINEVDVDALPNEDD